jgi:hypothetical protein
MTGLMRACKTTSAQWPAHRQARARTKAKDGNRGSAAPALTSGRGILLPYVLHAFQKKSKKGVKKPQAELDKIKRRLKEAEQASAEREE